MGMCIMGIKESPNAQDVFQSRTGHVSYTACTIHINIASVSLKSSQDSSHTLACTHQTTNTCTCTSVAPQTQHPAGYSYDVAHYPNPQPTLRHFVPPHTTTYVLDSLNKAQLFGRVPKSAQTTQTPAM